MTLDFFSSSLFSKAAQKTKEKQSVTIRLRNAISFISEKQRENSEDIIYHKNLKELFT